MMKKILIGHDGSRGASKALQVAIDLAKRYQAELHQITVREHLPRYVEELGRPVGIGRVLSTEHDAADYAHQVCRESRREATAEGVELITHVVHGDAAEEIRRVVELQGGDLLVIGFNGHSALFGHNRGSTSEQLIRLSYCSVLVVR